MLTEILSGLWIGNIEDSYDLDFYRDNKISIIINHLSKQGLFHSDL